MLCIADFGQARLLTSGAGGSLSRRRDALVPSTRAPLGLSPLRSRRRRVGGWVCARAAAHSRRYLRAVGYRPALLRAAVPRLTDASWPGYRAARHEQDPNARGRAECRSLTDASCHRGARPPCATMLVYDSCRRPTCRDALHDPWFAQAAPEMSCVLAQDDNTLDDNVLQVGTSLGTPPVAPLAELLQDIERVAASASAAGSRDSSMRRSNRVKAAAAPVAFPWHMF